MKSQLLKPRFLRTTFLLLNFILILSACDKKNCLESANLNGPSTGRCGSSLRNNNSGGSTVNSSGIETAGSGVSGPVNCNGPDLSRPCVDQSETYRVFSACTSPVRYMCDSSGTKPYKVDGRNEAAFCISGAMFYSLDEVLRSCNPIQ